MLLWMLPAIATAKCQFFNILFHVSWIFIPIRFISFALSRTSLAWMYISPPFLRVLWHSPRVLFSGVFHFPQCAFMHFECEKCAHKIGWLASQRVQRHGTEDWVVEVELHQIISISRQNIQHPIVYHSPNRFRMLFYILSILFSFSVDSFRLYRQFEKK